MAKRKTIDIETLKKNANSYLLNSHDKFKGERHGFAIALEAALHATGNYRGFGYLNSDDMVSSEYGRSVGINTSRSAPSETLTYEEKFQDTDGSRRFYY